MCRSTPHEWMDASLGELLLVGSGDSGSYKSGDYTKPVPVYGANGPIGSYTKSNFGPGYIIGRVGAAGEVSRVDNKVWASDNTLTAIPLSSRCDFSFAGHLLQWLDLSKLITKSAQPLLTQSKLKEVRAVIPILKEQRRIAEVLDTVDAAIQQTDEVIAKLKQVKTGLLQDLLTRGLDEHGRLRDPERHPEQFKDSPLGRIPRGWEVVPLDTIGRLVTGNTPKSGSKDAWGDYMPFITPGEIRPDNSIGEAERWLSRQGVLSVRPIPEGSVSVVCIGSTIGKTALIHRMVATNQQINSVIPDLTHDSRYIYIAILSRANALKRMAGLQAVPIVNKTRFGNLLIPTPPLHEQQRIGHVIGQNDLMQQKEKSFRNKLRHLKHGLMQDLLTGRVRVPEAEAMVQEITY